MTAPLAAGGGPVIPNFGHGNTCVRDNHTFCWEWVKAHWSDTLGPALVQHIVLTLIALGVGFAISLACALFAHRQGWFERPFAAFSSILYTIPSLALFQFLVPVTDFSTTTAEIALVSYTLLILFRNTLTGLRSVPEETLEAARGMGLSDRQILWKVELPIAVPAIIAGLRVAAVTTISLATIAAYVADKGLGSPIFQALQTNFTTELLAAGGLAVALALTADALLLLAQRLLIPWARYRRA
jgi:osmoprotectant transport system permease protein